MAKYDLVIITHLPSFYKVNLYNQLAKSKSIHVIFLGAQSLIRSNDFVSDDFDFKASFLSFKPFEARNKILCLVKLFWLLSRIKFKKLLVGGWEQPEFWLSLFLRPRKMNVLCLESGQESQVSGPKSWLKRIFLTRIGSILASGKPQEHLARLLSFSSPVYSTGGVGLFLHPKQPVQSKAFRGRFLYVGRLSPEKNIEKLVQAFKQRPQFKLTIVGEGPLKIKPSANVQLAGYVPQEQLAGMYQSHDVFILPSTHEPWGLVVEEALFHHMPVLVSSKVGAKELIEEHGVGKIFSPSSLKSMLKAIDLIALEDIYQACLANMSDTMIEKMQAKQVQTYLKVAS